MLQERPLHCTKRLTPRPLDPPFTRRVQCFLVYHIAVAGGRRIGGVLHRLFGSRSSLPADPIIRDRPENGRGGGLDDHRLMICGRTIAICYHP